MKDPFKVGLVGCGRIAQAYCEVLTECPVISLEAVLDTRKEAADAVAERANAKAFYDLDSFLASNSYDAAIVCTPPHSHKEIVTALLNQGRHVLCEKPLAPSFEDGVAMMESAKKNNRRLMMASKFRYAEDVISTKAIVASGLLGRVQYFENCFTSPVRMSERWNSDPNISGGGVFIDNGTHSVDIVRYLLGPIKSVRASDTSVGDLKVEDTVTVSFITESDVKGSLYLSWNLQLDRNAFIGIYGTDGRLRVNWDDASYMYPGHPEWVSFGEGYNKREAFMKQVVNFVEAIQGSAEPLITDEEALDSIAVVEAGYRSLKSGKWEDVKRA